MGEVAYDQVRMGMQTELPGFEFTLDSFSKVTNWPYTGGKMHKVMSSFAPLQFGPSALYISNLHPVPLLPWLDLDRRWWIITYNKWTSARHIMAVKEGMVWNAVIDNSGSDMPFAVYQQRINKSRKHYVEMVSPAEA